VEIEHELAADQRLDALAPGFFGKFQGAEEIAGIGDPMAGWWSFLASSRTRASGIAPSSSENAEWTWRWTNPGPDDMIFL